MKTNDFMNANLETLKKMIEDLLNDAFDSHDFIKAFAKENEYQYVSLLGQYENEPHRIVHSQIARNLLKNKDYLKIEKNGNNISKSVFGFNNPNALWNKGT